MVSIRHHATFPKSISSELRCKLGSSALPHGASPFPWPDVIALAQSRAFPQDCSVALIGQCPVGMLKAIELQSYNGYFQVVIRNIDNMELEQVRCL